MPSNRTYLPQIDIPAEQITPLYDWLLVRRLHEEEYTGLIIPPGMVQGRGGQWLRKADTGPRRGQVVVAGRGDKRAPWLEIDQIPGLIAAAKLPSRITGAMNGRHPMAVQVGDVILYPRFESSHVNIQGEQLTFVREGDVMAVLDET